MNQHKGKILAKELLWISDQQKNLYPYQWEELKEEQRQLISRILDSDYSVNDILNWIEEYKLLTIEQHREWIKE